MKISRKFGIWGNTDKKSFWTLLPDLFLWAKKNNLEAHITTRIKSHPNAANLNNNVIESPQQFRSLDFILSLGGDGTFLSLVRSLGKLSTPILGVHLGDLGFLAKVVLGDIFNRLNQIIKGDFVIEKRMLAKASIFYEGETKSFVALNDFVFSNGEAHRMLTINVKVDGSFVGSYKSDGLIIATPTGSTAYSLSAGGPIITPSVDSLIITPTSAHTLTSRPLVVPGNSVISVEFSKADKSVLFVADGQLVDPLSIQCKIKVFRNNFSVNLIDFKDSDYFDTLRTKMGWGKRG